MQPVLNVEDIKRVEIALTRVGVAFPSSCTVQPAAAQGGLGMEGHL